uniref:Monodehydroascorbate reductase n=1 Tax=Tanacetum cinerariifolium TaxID=118510 RepID=A0A699I5F3_TANCI|nr:hypothetical protein [Tanacetum cinerariifolium]
MATTIEQQVALDEVLVPSTQGLRIGRSNFRLPSDIQSKESTLQLVYDVLRRSPFFKAFLVTADVLEIYMQELWATANVHQHSIRFKMNNKKHIVRILDFIRFLGHSATIRTLTDVNINKLYQPWRSFAAIINKFLTGKSSGYDSFRLSQAQILWGLYHKRNIDYSFLIWEDFVYQVEHKNHKKGSEMYYPRFTKVIIHHFMSKDPSIPRRNKVNWHYVRDDFMFLTIKVVSRHQKTQQYGAILHIELTNDEIRNTKAYKEYYAFATGEAAPKPKASARRKISGSDTSITPPTVAVTPKLTAAAKGKQPAKATKAKRHLPSQSLVVQVQMKELVLNQGFWMYPLMNKKINSHGTLLIMKVLMIKEGTEIMMKEMMEMKEVAKYDEQDDVEGGGDDEEEGESDEEDDNEETRDEESFNPIPKPLKAVKMKVMVKRIKGRGLQATLEVEDSYVTLTPVNPDGQQESSSVSSQFMTSMLNPTSDAANFFEFRQTNLFAEAISAIPGIVHQYINQQMNETMEGNKSIQRSDEQRNLYKALVDAYEADKIILDSYGETVILKRRRDDDDDDKDEGPSARSDQGSKRWREVKEPESASAPLKTTTRSACRSTTRSKSRQASASEPAFTEEPHPEWFSQPEKPPTPDRDWNKTLPAVQGSTQTWISELAKQDDSRSSFNELLDTPLDFSNFIINRLRVDTLTLELFAGPTFKLMKGSCKSMIKLEYNLEEVYKATMDQLDWVNPEGQQCPHNLLQPLSLIPDNRGRRVIPFTHFINNNLEYLRGVESYQKRLNLTKPDTYNSDLKQREAYIAYSNPRGFIYQNKDKKNRLMQIDELHKFSDGTLNDVRTALDDRLKGIKMRYLPHTIWRKSDKDRAAAMFQAIDKMLKTRRIMRSLEKFIGGRLYEGDFRMLQRTI